MTPDEAQHAIRDAEYIGANLPGECWRALDTIAGMRTEYAIAYLDRDGNITLMDEGYETLAAAQHRQGHLMAKVRPHTRIMRRPVGEWEEA